MQRHEDLLRATIPVDTLNNDLSPLLAFDKPTLQSQSSDHSQSVVAGTQNPEWNVDHEFDTFGQSDSLQLIVLDEILDERHPDERHPCKILGKRAMEYQSSAGNQTSENRAQNRGDVEVGAM